jgi:ABC-type uncharacterized transport system permease subunit
VSGVQSPLPLLHNAVSIMTPFLLAAIGGLFTELAGMLNIALEGLILVGSFFAVVFAGLTGSLLAGVLLGVAATLLVALLFGAVSLYLEANVFITGLATNLLASGLTAVLALRLFGNKGVLRFALPGLPVLSLQGIPALRRIPVLGDLLLGHNVLVYVSWLVLALAALLIHRTPFGLRLRGAGLGRETLSSLGLKPKRYQLAAILISGLTCGLAGAALTLRLGAFVPNISGGRGWIALVVIYLGNKTPAGILAAALLFGLAESLANYAQGATNVPAELILAFPYLLTVVAMTLYSIWRFYRGRA